MSKCPRFIFAVTIMYILFVSPRHVRLLCFVFSTVEPSRVSSRATSYDTRSWPRRADLPVDRFAVAVVGLENEKNQTRASSHLFSARTLFVSSLNSTATTTRDMATRFRVPFQLSSPAPAVPRRRYSALPTTRSRRKFYPIAVCVYSIRPSPVPRAETADAFSYRVIRVFAISSEGVLSEELKSKFAGLFAIMSLLESSSLFITSARPHVCPSEL